MKTSFFSYFIVQIFSPLITELFQYTRQLGVECIHVV